GSRAYEYPLKFPPRPAPGAAVDVALEPLIETQPCTPQDFRIQPTPIVYNHAYRRPGGEAAPGVRKDVGDAVDVGADRLSSYARRRAAELDRAPLLQAEKLVRV